MFLGDQTLFMVQWPTTVWERLGLASWSCGASFVGLSKTRRTRTIIHCEIG